MEIELEERTTGHASYTNMERVLQVLDEIDLTDLTAKQQQMVERIRITFNFLKESLDKVDPWLVSNSTMNYINNPISEVLGQITNFRNNKNEGHLSNSFDQLEALVTYFSQLVVSKTPEEIENVRTSVVTFRKSVGQLLSNLEKDGAEASASLAQNTERINELSTSINNQKGRIDSIISDFQNQFLEMQTDRASEFSNFIKISESNFEELSARVDESINEQLEQHKLLLEEQSEEHRLLLEEQTELRRAIFENQIKQQQETFDTIEDSLKTEMKSGIERINLMNQEAEKILGLMSMKGLAQGYQKIANTEGRKALIWNLSSIASIIVILWFGFEFIIQHEGTMDWSTLLSRIILTGVGLTLFTYCAKQATNHRNEERHNRRIELELASLDPYLKDLEDEQQKEVKQSLVNKYFGAELSNSQQSSNQQNVEDSLTSNPEFLRILAEKLVGIIPNK